MYKANGCVSDLRLLLTWKFQWIVNVWMGMDYKRGMMKSHATASALPCPGWTFWWFLHFTDCQLLSNQLYSRMLPAMFWAWQMDGSCTDFFRIHRQMCVTFIYEEIYLVLSLTVWLSSVSGISNLVVPINWLAFLMSSIQMEHWHQVGDIL